MSAAGLAALPATTAEAATTCAAGVWKADYYANTTLTGTPKKSVCDTSVNENYGTGAPAGVSLPKDNFGVRWTTSRNFGSGGAFSFTAAAQDGIRVYLDGVRKIDLWKNVASTQSKTVNVTIPRGTHTIRVDFAAFTGSANVTFSYAPRTSASVDTVAPLAPGGVRASYSSSTLKTTLSWAKNAEMDLAGYRVYRRTGTSSSWTVVSGSKLLTSPAYANTPAATGSALGYAVVAVDKAGRASARSTEARVTTADKTAPAAAKEFTAAATVGGNALSWKAGDTGTASYLLTDGLTPHILWAKVTGTSYVDKGGATTGPASNYSLYAVDAAGNRSTAVSTKPSYPAPSGATASGSAAGISLSWAYDSGLAPSGFRVYRAPAADGPWTAVADVPSASTTYLDTTAPVGYRSYYHATALGSTGWESSASSTVSALRPDPSDTTAAMAPRVTLDAPYTQCTPQSCAPNGGAGVVATLHFAPNADETSPVVGYMWRAVWDNTYHYPTGSTDTWTPPHDGVAVIEVYAQDASGWYGPATQIQFTVA